MTFQDKQCLVQQPFVIHHNRHFTQSGFTRSNFRRRVRRVYTTQRFEIVCCRVHMIAEAFADKTRINQSGPNCILDLAGPR